MTRVMTLLAGGLMLAATAACTNSPTVTDRQLECAGGATAGGLLGGVVGNQFGSGKGKTAATVVGAGAGAYAGSRAAGC